MHVYSILSNVNAPCDAGSSIQTNDDYIIFHHGVRKVLVPLPTSYEDASSLVRELFPAIVSKAYTISFETDELNISKGERVTIHRTAWEGVAKMLANVHVISTVNVKNELKKESSIAGTEYFDANTTARQATDPEASDDEIYRSSRRKLVSNMTTERLNVSVSKSGKSTGNIKIKKMGESAFLGSPARVTPSATMKRKGGFTPSKSKPVTNGKSKVAKVDPLNLFPDEPVKREVDSDAEERAEVAGALEGTAESDERDHDARSTVSNTEEGQEHGHGVFAGIGEMKPPKTVKAAARANSNDTESSYVHVPQKTISSSNSVPSSIVSAPSFTNTDASTTLPDRILVVVDYEQGDAPEMKFRVRPAITVARLLQAICKQFELEYERTQLHMLIEVEGGGEAAVERVFCPMNEALASLGAREGQRFVVGEIGESS